MEVLPKILTKTERILQTTEVNVEPISPSRDNTEKIIPPNIRKSIRPPTIQKIFSKGMEEILERESAEGVVIDCKEDIKGEDSIEFKSKYPPSELKFIVNLFQN